jgi:hypothetical protein
VWPPLMKLRVGGANQPGRAIELEFHEPTTFATARNVRVFELASGRDWIGGRAIVGEAATGAQFRISFEERVVLSGVGECAERRAGSILAVAGGGRLELA